MSEHTDSASSPAPATRAEARRRTDRSGGADISRALDRHDRRIGWMDLLRGLSILLVILHHSTQITAYRIGEVPGFFEFVSNFFAPFRMPMLMFLSGLLVAGSLHVPAGKYVWGKVRRILWPIFVWTLVYAAMEFVAEPSQVKFMPWELGFWNTYLWFMQFVFAYYIIALLMKWLPIWVLFAVPFVLMFVIPADLELLRRFFYLMPFFFLGAFIEKHWDEYAKRLSVPLAAGLAIIPIGVGLYSGLIAPLWYEPLSAVPAMLGIMILVRLTAVAPDVRWLAPARFVGRYSLIYYVSHYPVFAALGWLALKVGFDNPTLGLLVIFLATVAISTGFALLGRRMPVSLLFELPRRLWPAKKATAAA